MSTPFKTYLIKDTLVIALTNCAMNAAYTAYLWRGNPTVALYDALGVATDLALTPAVIALLSTLLGTAAARAKLADGRVDARGIDTPDLLRLLPKGIVLRSLFMALLAAAALAAPTWLLLYATGVQALPLAGAVGLKVLITAVMTAALIPVVVHAALADVRPAPSPRFAT